ncbi:MAG: class I SAM-dependent methyltransferase [Pseudomonadota bacterium]
MQHLNTATNPFSYPLSQDQNNLDLLISETNDALDAALSMDVRQGMNVVRLALYFLRQKASDSDWKKIIHDILRPHPVCDILHKDPFTYRAFAKPRGYAGDAVMIDYIYRNQEALDLGDPAGELVYAVSTNSPSTRAVRNRLNYIVNKIDDICRSVESPEIFSVACGHCREFGFSEQFQAKKGGRFVAMDQDAESLAQACKDYSTQGLETMEGSVTTLLKQKGPAGAFDLIYALGLYDYLNERLAMKLTENLFNRLKPGGELVIANFMPDILDIGYMEAYMDWELVYRDSIQMRELTEKIPENSISELRTFTEPERNIVFLQLRRA